MNRFHIAIATDNIEKSVADYSERFRVPPCVVVPGEYALWRTEGLNFSVRRDASRNPGTLRHLGWEDATASEFTQDTDVNGVVWERFSAPLQAEEINQIWPEASYPSPSQ